MLSTRRIVANLSVKALYEVTKIKMLDPALKGLSDQQVFALVAGQAKMLGLRLVH
jgi:ribosomal protein L11